MATTRRTQQLLQIQAENLVHGIEISTYDAAGLDLLKKHSEIQYQRLKSLAASYCAKDAFGLPANNEKIAFLTDTIGNIHGILKDIIESDPLNDPNAKPEDLSEMFALFEQLPIQANADFEHYIEQIRETFPATQHEKLMNICSSMRENLTVTLNFINHHARLLKSRAEQSSLLPTAVSESAKKQVTQKLTRSASSSSIGSMFSSDLEKSAAAAPAASDSAIHNLRQCP